MAATPLARGVLRRRDLVPDAPDGHDRRGVAELAAELADVDVDGARVAGEGVAPDALEQLVAREHEAAVVEQLPEQVELLRRELDLLLADAHLAAAGVDRQVAVAELLALDLAALGRRAAEDRLHAGDELARVERLRQVVVGADLEPDDLVDVLVARGQHQDRHVRALADAPADLDPVDVREHQVEHDQRGLARPRPARAPRCRSRPSGRRSRRSSGRGRRRTRSSSRPRRRARSAPYSEASAPRMPDAPAATGPALRGRTASDRPEASGRARRSGTWPRRRTRSPPRFRPRRSCPGRARRR